MAQLYDYLAIPFGFVLRIFYDVFSNYWIALFMLVLIVRLILLPSSIKQQKSTAKQTRLQPKVNRIRAKYSAGGQPTREQQAKIQQETQDLYSKEGYNPMGAGCLPLLIQFPVMMGLYGVVYEPLSKVLNISDAVIQKAATALSIDISSAGKGLAQYEIQLMNKLTAANMPECLAANSDSILRLQHQFKIFGMDLTQTPSFKEFNILWLIPLFALITGCLSSILMLMKQKKQQSPDMAGNKLTMGCMSFMPAVMSLVFTFMFPAGVGMYWIMSNVVSFVQTIVLDYKYTPAKVIAVSMVDETVERRSREASVKSMRALQEQKQAEG